MRRPYIDLATERDLARFIGPSLHAQRDVGLLMNSGKSLSMQREGDVIGAAAGGTGMVLPRGRPCRQAGTRAPTLGRHAMLESALFIAPSLHA